MAWPLDVLTGATAFGAFAFANLLGWQLWSRRAVLKAHTALQVFLAATFLVSLLVLTVADRRVGIAAFDPDFSTGSAYAVLLVFPILMFVFWMRERAARREG